MKHIALYLTVGLAFSATSFIAAEDGRPKDDQKLERTAADIDDDAARPEGQKNVESRLKSEYKVDDARIQGLRDQKMGWGQIAKQQGTTIGKINGRVKGVDAAARKHEKTEGKVHEKAEHAEHLEKPEKHERVERPEKPKH